MNVARSAGQLASGQVEAILFSSLLIGAGVWLSATALRDMKGRWVFTREFTRRQAGPDASPFRLAELVDSRTTFDDLGERRALALARVASVTFLVLIELLAFALGSALATDARWIIAGWCFALGGLMVRDQLCREWWLVVVGVPALGFALLIDPTRWPFALGLWLVHLGLRVGVELRQPRPAG